MTTREMEDTTTMISSKSVLKHGNLLQFEIRNVPVQFVNAIRRILLNETPVVEVADVQIFENDTLMPHEVLRHRTEMLPVNVHPAQEDLIRDTKLVLRMTAEGDRIITTDDFANNVLMRDVDLGTPLFFLKLKKGQKIHIQAGLALNPRGSQVCQATYSYHIDEDRAKEDASKYEDKDSFQNLYKQRSFYINSRGRPYWFDFVVESIGVIPAVDTLKNAVRSLKMRTIEWIKQSKEKIIRESEEGVFHIMSEETHTLGALLQIVAYELCPFASYDVPHPLKPEMKFRFKVPDGSTPENILAQIEKVIVELCDATISGMDK